MLNCLKWLDTINTLQNLNQDNTAALSKITDFMHRLFPSPLVKISIPLEGIHFLSFLTLIFKINWVFNSVFQKFQMWTSVTTDCISQLKLHLRLPRLFWKLEWQDLRKRDLHENLFASLLLQSSDICFHLHYLYWLCNPPPVIHTEVLVPLLFCPTFSCSYTTLQRKNVHIT